MDLQFIGIDLGRGYTKGYTEYKGKPKECLFQSTIGEGREIDYSDYDRPIYLKINTEEVFIGNLAEKESFNPLPNYSDDKTTDVAQKLLYSALNELAESEYVKICIGVPNKAFNKATLEKVSTTYSGRMVTVEDRIKKTIKNIVIVKVDIFREADAALFHVVNNSPNRTELQKSRNGMITVGFRTSEISYFDKGMKYNDKLSRTIELGNRTVLDVIQKTLSKQGIMKELSEIDNDTDYSELKEAGYKRLMEKINQTIEMNWINFKEMNIFLGGGTSKNFKFIPDKFKTTKEQQFLTAKGLYFIAERWG